MPTSVGEIAKPSKSDLDTEFGVYIAGLPFSEPYDGKSHVLLRVSEPSIRQLVEMRRNDGQARALYRLITMPVRAAAMRATWVAADGGEKEAKFAEDLLTLPFVSGGMRTPFQKVLGQLLLAISDGFAPFELVYTVPKRGPLQGKITLSKIAYRPCETVQFLVSDNGDFEGLRQRTTGPNGRYVDEKIDKDSAFYYACGDDENPFYGVSYFNAAFYHYDKKVKLYYLAHLAAQHRAVGSRLGKYPPGASPVELAAFRKALANFGLAQSVTVPDKGWSVEDLGKQLGDFPFMEFINHHNSQMSKSVMAPFLDDDQGGQKSLVDFGGQTDSLYMTMIGVIVAELEDLINNVLLPRFIDWNFGTQKYPKIKFGPFTDEQKASIKETFDKLVTAGQSANVTRPFLLELEKYMSEEMGLDIDYEKITEALEKQEEATLEHFMQEAAQPPMVQPFQPIGTAPADRQQGVPPQAQWLPGPQPLLPPGQAGASPNGQPVKKKFPALPSQLTASEIPSDKAWLHADAPIALSWADWREAVGVES